ncbi:MAG: FHA domain-containing protein [Phycisphaerales bacterium]
MNVTLLVFAPNGKSRSIPLKPGRYIVGRHETATLRIPHPQVSRQHCEFTIEPSSIVVRDLKSANGTFRNHQKIDAGTLEAGDFIAIGPFLLGVQVDGHPANLRPPAPEAPAPKKPAADMLAETPPAGSPALASTHDTDDPDKTVTHSKAGLPSIKSKLSPDDSSVFDFDFDFEDDNKAKKR